MDFITVILVGRESFAFNKRYHTGESNASKYILVICSKKESLSHLTCAIKKKFFVFNLTS